MMEITSFRSSKLMFLNPYKLSFGHETKKGNRQTKDCRQNNFVPCFRLSGTYSSIGDARAYIYNRSHPQREGELEVGAAKSKRRSSFQEGLQQREGKLEVGAAKSKRRSSFQVKTEVIDRRVALVTEIKDIFRSMNDGEISSSAYDTAWVARIPSTKDPKKLQFPTTLNWILRNQLEDGSWGEPSTFLIYDRLVCTLSCVLALKTWSTGKDHVAQGLKFLQTHIIRLEKENKNSMTVGFELIFPSLLNEAKSFGLDLPYHIPCLKEIFTLREKKISKIPKDMMHSMHTTVLHSLEGVQEIVNWKKILKLQSKDGGFLTSPSSTAVVYMKTGDRKCLEYLSNIVKRYGDYAPCLYPVDIYEHIWAIDTLQRLGIDHFFQNEISEALSYVHRNLKENGASWGRENPIPDIDDTCMALRLLRLHGISVPTDILNHFKDKNGNFFCFPWETHTGISDMFNLYRFSQISFPGENILLVAKSFTEQYLKKCLENNDVDDKWLLKKDLKKQVAYGLKFPWKTSLKRLETREYIDSYGDKDVWIGKTVYWMHNINNSKYMELAKLDYGVMQSVYRRETNFIMKWWNQFELAESVTLLHPEEIHFSIAATLYEPELDNCRIAYTKSNCIEDNLVDLFHNHRSTEDLNAVCHAVEQWNPSLVCSLPNNVKAVFNLMYGTLQELAIQASNAQGKDVFPYLHDIRLKQIQHYLNTRMKKGREHNASWKEYIENRKKDFGVAIRVMPAMLLMGEHLEDDHLRCLDEQSNIHNQMSLYLTLMTDVTTYKNRMAMENVSPINIYMKENKYSKEEAMNQLKKLKEDTFQQLVYEYLKPHPSPRICRKLIFEHGRISHFFDDAKSTPHLYKEKISGAMGKFLSPTSGT